MNWQEEQKKVATGVTGGQEPVAWMDKSGITHKHKHFEDMTPLYTHPQLKREWVGLTDEEVIGLMKQFPDHLTRDVARAIEAKLKEKNCL